MHSTSDNLKPLSQKPAGYGLAFLGGALGGPLGFITSPLTLLVLNRLRRRNDQDHPNRFRTWALLGILGAPISWLAFLVPLMMIPEALPQGCIKADNVKNTYSPYILYQSIPKCMLEGDADSAAFLWRMVKIYGRYDMLRVKDETAKAAIDYLEMRLLQQDLDQDKAKKLAEAVNTSFSITEMCAQARRIGAPDYHPAYMIEHGIEAMMEKNSDHDGLVPNYSREANWKEITSQYMKCPVD